MPRILLFPVGEEPKEVVIKNGLKPMQAIVGGLIEQVTLASGLGLIFNEEGRLMDLPVNRYVTEIGDVIRGPMFLSRYNGAGETVDVTKADVKKYAKRFAPVEP